MNENISSFKKETSVIKSEITQAKEKIIRHLNVLEQLLLKLSHSKKTVILKLAIESTRLKTLRSSINYWLLILETSINQGSNQQYQEEKLKVS